MGTPEDVAAEQYFTPPMGMKKCSRCKRKFPIVHKWKGGVLCPECLERAKQIVESTGGWM